MDSHRRQILRSVAQLLEQIDGEAPSKFTITIDTGETVITIQPREDELAIGELPEAQQLILSQFEMGQTLTTDQIARLSGYSNGGRFRKHLADLKAIGLLELTESGYKRVPGGGTHVPGGRNTDPGKNGNTCIVPGEQGG